MRCRHGACRRYERPSTRRRESEGEQKYGEAYGDDADGTTVEGGGLWAIGELSIITVAGHGGRPSQQS